NRNVLTLKAALEERLGYAVDSRDYSNEVDLLIAQYRAGASVDQLLQMDLTPSTPSLSEKKLFANVDGIKFLNHDMGCGGTRLDSDAACELRSDYIKHPKVAGAAVLS